MSKPPPPEEFLRDLPKVELHCHLDGAVRPATLYELAGKPGEFDAFRESVTVLQPAPFQKVLSAFHKISPLLRSRMALDRAAFELVEDRAAENTRHLETRFAPTLHESDGFDVDAAVEAVLGGLRRGGAEFRVSTGLVVCLLRGLPDAQNGRAFEAAKRWFGRGVVGIDVADFGGDVPTRLFEKQLREAADLGIPFTIHAGERAGREDLESALEFGAARIGHGTRLVDYPDLLKRFADKRTPVEICLSSNRMTGAVSRIEDHPAKRLAEAGLPVTFNTDDPGLFGLTLTGELEIAMSLGFSEIDLIDAQKAAAEALFERQGAPA
jgi:adenosine deaminase